MATRKSTSKARSDRNHTALQGRASTGRVPPVDFEDGVGPDSPRSALEEAIDDERLRLMQTHTVLGCVMRAMDDEDSYDQSDLHFPSVIEISRNLINQSIRCLDPDAIGRLVDAVEQSAKGAARKKPKVTPHKRRAH